MTDNRETPAPQPQTRHTSYAGRYEQIRALAARDDDRALMLMMTQCALLLTDLLEEQARVAEDVEKQTELLGGYLHELAIHGVIIRKP